ncbi:MAG: hypothetical protein K6F53_00685 [Lachnospiraceae bacterium]|nr:hypothetical protein [Lachnospiraceae bacterium]
MKYPIFASLILLSLWLMFAIHRSRNGAARRFQEFLDNEVRANNTRKKPLDDLHYITIPLETLPVTVLKEDPEIAECLGIMHDLSEKKIVNLTGISNTDLKLRYGAPNLDYLARCDECYTLLARTMDKWAHILYSKGFEEEAKTVLEFAISTGTDVRGSYELLCGIYASGGEQGKIEALIPTAEALNSLTKNGILSMLEKYSAPPEG